MGKRRILLEKLRRERLGIEETDAEETDAEETDAEETEDQKLQRGMQRRVEYSRNADQICLNCLFWEFEDDGGVCKRYPPSVKSGPTNRIDMWEFPEVTYDKWCGEWRPFPEKDGYYAVATPVESVADDE